MEGRRLLIHSAAVLLLPLLVAWLGLSVASALALVLLALVWRWALSLANWVAPERSPELVLETITASHFVEKIRWCLDRLGLDYKEKQNGGTLNAFFLGRSVPLLHFRTGAVRSRIGNSPEILRYLWGRYGAVRAEDAAFLEPTAERLELESRIDRCGVNLQVWVYYHLLSERELTLRAWGCANPAIPAWQRLALRLLYPLQRELIRRAFRISEGRYERAKEHVSELLAWTEERLADGRPTILGGEAVNFTDIAFAAIMGLWRQPPDYGGDKADPVRLARDDLPAAMLDDMAAWSATYPHSAAFIDALYETRR